LEQTSQTQQKTINDSQWRIGELDAIVREANERNHNLNESLRQKDEALGHDSARIRQKEEELESIKTQLEQSSNNFIQLEATNQKLNAFVNELKVKTEQLEQK
jgi:chromosome segregation ATPase